MISKFIKSPIYVFIDVENTFYAQKTLNWKLSYEKLMDYLERECGKDLKCFAYSGVDETNVKQKKFLDMLDIVGYITRTKSVKRIKTKDGNIKWKSNLDIEMALEMIELAEKFNTLILFSGDSDFAVVLDKLKSKDKKVITVSTRGRVAKELLERAKFVDLRKLKNEISQ
jgi:uncharacterized LabA/DUF88 family protein